MNQNYPLSAEDIEALKDKISRVIDSYNETFNGGISEVEYKPEDFEFTVNFDFSTAWFTIDPQVDRLGNFDGKWTATVWTPVPSENSASDTILGSDYPDVLAASIAICQAYHDARMGDWRLDISTPEEPV